MTDHNKFHILNKTARTAIPYGHIYFDTETKYHKVDNGDTEHVLRLGTAIYKLYDKELNTRARMRFEYREGKKFYDFVMSKIKNTRRIVIFAHNIFFDLWITQFYYHAFNDGWVSRIPYSKGLIFMDRLKKDKWSIDLVNVGNFFKTTVKKLGDMVGLPKLDVNFDAVSDRKLMTYCHRDTEILEKVMFEWFSFIKSENLGNFGMTLSAQAFNAFRHRFMNCKIYVHRQNQPVDLERSGYFGGRVECFFIGKAKKIPYVKIDLNSMYPFIMRENVFPTRYIAKDSDLSFIRLKQWLKSCCVTAKVELNTNEACYPTKKDGKTIFPIGQFITTLSTPELQYAYEHHHIVRVIEAARYAKETVFADYVDYMYGKRLEFKKSGQKVYEQAVKILLNSLYGKFGQKLRESDYKDIKDNKLVKRETIYDIRDNSVKSVITFGGRVKTSTTQYVDSFNAMTTIAAHVTAHARMYLWKFIKIAPKGKLFYCDTDSLLIAKSILGLYKEYLDDTRLGAFKVEDESNNMEIKGLKHYCFGDDWKIKGIPKKAIKIDEHTFLTEQWPGFPSTFNKKLTDPYTVKQVTKHLTCKYNKGTVSKSGWVKPLELHLFD